MGEQTRSIRRTALPPIRFEVWITLSVACGVLAVLAAISSHRVGAYVDTLDRYGVLYTLPIAVIGGLYLLLRYPRLPIFALAAVLPFNFIGGYWGDTLAPQLAKILEHVLAALAVLSTFLAPPAERAWITRTRLGRAVMLWLAIIAIGFVVGGVSVDNTGDWLRESDWMFLYACILPFGTLLARRRQLERVLLWCVTPGVIVMQTYAFWMLATGRRYSRADDWTAGDTFYRAQFAPVNMLVLYAAAAALFYYAASNRLTRRSGLLLLAIVTSIGGGLLASMGRSLWIAGAVGAIVLLMLVPWTKRSGRAALALAGGALLALALVAVFDNLSSQSSGNWLGNAYSFFLDIGEKDSVSRLTRELEWSHAFDVWKRSPVIGMGYGYPFPYILIGKVAESVLPDAFYMHNSYMNVLAKSGTVGLLALLYLIWEALRAAYQLLRRSDADIHQRILGAALTASMVQMVFVSFLTPVITTMDTIAYFAMLIGLAIAAERAANRELARDALS
jgi:O-antigen ligase